ncbi:hypothetical protein [Candidatus Harpocratesius sp.]
MKKTRKNFDYLKICSSLIFILISLSEFLVISFENKRATWLHFGFCFIWLLMLLINWNFVISHLRNDILPKKYRAVYFTVVMVIIIALYLILLYPISPYIEILDIFFKFLPTYIGGLSSLFSITAFVSKDIEFRQQTGRSLLQQDKTVKHLKKIFVLELCIFFPIVVFIALMLSAFLYTMSKDLNISTFVVFFIPFFLSILLIFIWIAVIIKKGREIKKNLQ